jgi:methionyl-tRNA synthetase
MGRSGYSEDCYDDSNVCFLWPSIVQRAASGQRGQAFLREMLAAMDAMPDKKLIADELATEVAASVAGIIVELEQCRLQSALIGITALVTRVNQYIDQTAPFKLAKDPGQSERLDVVLYNMVEACRILSVLLWPYIPATAVRIYEQLALTESPNQMSNTAWGRLKTGHRIGAPSPPLGIPVCGRRRRRANPSLGSIDTMPRIGRLLMSRKVRAS